MLAVVTLCRAQDEYEYYEEEDDYSSDYFDYENDDDDAFDDIFSDRIDAEEQQDTNDDHQCKASFTIESYAR